MYASSRNTVLQVAATISYYTARNIRLDSESSKLLILAPHNDTISDLEDALGAPDTDLPPTLYDFYLVALYRLHYTLVPVCQSFPNATTTTNLFLPRLTLSPLSLYLCPYQR